MYAELESILKKFDIFLMDFKIKKTNTMKMAKRTNLDKPSGLILGKCVLDIGLK